MNAEQFFKKVKEMRKAQKAYFQSRMPDDLRKSKALEAEIDREIKRTEEIKATLAAEAISPRLFADDDYKTQPPAK